MAIHVAITTSYHGNKYHHGNNTTVTMATILLCHHGYAIMVICSSLHYWYLQQNLQNQSPKNINTCSKHVSRTEIAKLVKPEDRSNLNWTNK